MKRHIARIIVCLSWLNILSGASWAQSDASSDITLRPRVEIGGRVGTERSIGVTEAWIPVVQSDQADKVIYTDLRYMGDNEDNQEGNLGVGYRQIVGDHIVGAHGWIDRRSTDSGSIFYQATIGGEFMKDDWDLKANAYMPLSDSRVVATLPNVGQANPYMVGTGLFVDTNGEIVEEPQAGVDIEAGYRIPAFEQNIDAIRIYGGLYAFDSDQTDAVVGARLRASVDVNPLLNVGARVQSDDERGAQGFIEATLRFPFTAKKRFQKHGLKARMDESPERDIDIVTATKRDNGLMKPVLNAQTGQTQRVLHVDNTAAGGGNGSVENPFNTLADAQAALKDNDTLYIHQGDGLTTGQNQGIVIAQNNVQLIGSGVDFVYDRDRFTTRRRTQNPTDGTVILAATTAPVITNTATPVDINDIYTGNGILVTGDNSLITGVTVQNTGYLGVRIAADGKTFNSATVDRVTATGNRGTGIAITSTNGGYIETATLTNSVSNNNLAGFSVGNGVTISGSTSGSTAGSFGTAIMEGNSTSGNTGTGVSFAGNAGQAENVIIRDNISNGNTQNGLSVSINGAGTIAHTTIQDNTTNGNTLAGINVSGSSGQLGQVDINHNTANNNQSNAVSVATTNRIDAIHIRNMSMDLNTGRGILVNPTAGAQVNEIIIEDNTSTRNTTRGIEVRSDGATTTVSNVTIRDNISSNNGSYGIHTIATNGGTFNDILIDDNTIDSNSQHGIYTYSNVGGKTNGLTIQDNTVSNNSQHGIIVQSQTAGQIHDAVVTGNSSTDNTQSGITVASQGDSQVTTSVSDNIIQNNRQHGLNVVVQQASPLNLDVSGNTITGNGISSNVTTKYYGVNIDHDGTAPVNIDLGGGGTSAGGNRIYSNTYQEIFVDSRPGTAAATTGSVIPTQSNWWGVNTGLNQTTRATFDNGTAGVNGSRLDSSNHLTVDPGP